MCVQYVENGVITIGAGYDRVVDIANLFGHDFAGLIMLGAVKHGVLNDIVIWWPTSPETRNGEWINSFNADETRLVTKSIDPIKTQEFLTAVINGQVFHGVSQRKTAYVFGRDLQCHGGDSRRYFKGVFEFDEAASNVQKGLVWNKTDVDSVPIYMAVHNAP